MSLETNKLGVIVPAYANIGELSAAGDLLVGDANAEPARLAVGAAGTVLTSTGTTPAWSFSSLGTHVYFTVDTVSTALAIGPTSQDGTGGGTEGKTTLGVLVNDANCLSVVAATGSAATLEPSYFSVVKAGKYLVDFRAAVALANTTANDVVVNVVIKTTTTPYTTPSTTLPFAEAKQTVADTPARTVTLAGSCIVALTAGQTIGILVTSTDTSHSFPARGYFGIKWISA